MPPRRKVSKAACSIGRRTKFADAGEKSIVESIEKAANSEEYRFSMELMWCLRELDGLRVLKKTAVKQREELLNVMKMLLSENTPFIKKRQLMRTFCGDYRSKMEKDDKQRLQVQPSFQPQPSLPKYSQFIRKVYTKEPGFSGEHLAEGLKGVCLSSQNTESDSREISSDNIVNSCQARLIEHDCNVPESKTNFKELFRKESSVPFLFNFEII